MPELPEVESFARALHKEYTQKPIKEVLFRRDNIRYTLDKKTLRNILCKGVSISRFHRDGKQLILETENGSIAISLGMSGTFHPANSKKPAKHEHITIVFADASALGYIDPRRFGFWIPYDKPLSHKADPLSKGSLLSFFTSEQFLQSSRSIKDILLDQKCIGGIGNIYAAEALFLASIHPQTSAKNILAAKAKLLAETIPTVLNKAIDKGGSTISTYRRLNKEVGDFQEFHKVYARHGKPCLADKCTDTVLRIVQSGRSTWYCPTCQPA